MIDLLRDLAAAPRPTGSDAIAAARDRCARDLRAMGFELQERPFEFSEFPGRFATPLFGGAAALIVGVAGHWGAAGARAVPLMVTTLGALALGVAGRWLARRGVLAAPVMRRRGINLQATRPGDAPRAWLCAHLDTKSQPVPTLVRTVGILLTGLGFSITLALSAIAAAGWRPHELFWTSAAVVTLIGAVPVVLSVVGSRSPGALDNASGVVTVLAAARELSKQPGVGVLLTDAEELGLAGARAWAETRRPGKTDEASEPGEASENRLAVVLNCDGVDDAGEILVMFSGRRPSAVLDAAARASAATGVPHRVRRLALGILTDSVAFQDAGIPSVTFSRVSLWSLGRVHSRRDDLAHLSGAGIADTATLMAATARALSEAQLIPMSAFNSGVTG